MKIKVVELGVNPKAFETWGNFYGLVTEEGELLYSHFCSNKGFAYGDLYLNRPERIKELNKRFGNVELIKD